MSAMVVSRNEPASRKATPSAACTVAGVAPGPIAASSMPCSSASNWLVFGGARCRWLSARHSSSSSGRSAITAAAYSSGGVIDNVQVAGRDLRDVGPNHQPQQRLAFGVGEAGHDRRLDQRIPPQKRTRRRDHPRQLRDELGDQLRRQLGALADQAMLIGQGGREGLRGDRRVGLQVGRARTAAASGARPHETRARPAARATGAPSRPRPGARRPARAISRSTSGTCVAAKPAGSMPATPFDGSGRRRPWAASRLSRSFNVAVANTSSRLERDGDTSASAGEAAHAAARRSPRHPRRASPGRRAACGRRPGRRRSAGSIGSTGRPGRVGTITSGRSGRSGRHQRHRNQRTNRPHLQRLDEPARWATGRGAAAAARRPRHADASCPRGPPHTRASHSGGRSAGAAGCPARPRSSSPRD